jgi:hypothetical protein
MTGKASRTFGVWALCAATVAFAGSQLSAQADHPAKNRGRAVVEFHDKAMHAVVAYNYSQRNHDSRWIVMQSALTTSSESIIHRGDIVLRTPQGSEIPLASQERVGDEVKKVEQLLQNAKVEAHDVLSYFKQQDRVEEMQLFRLPFGPVVHDEFIVDRDHIATGSLFFESPSGTWAAGAYVLVIKHPNGIAEIPVTLE